MGAGRTGSWVVGRVQEERGDLSLFVGGETEVGRGRGLPEVTVGPELPMAKDSVHAARQF